LASVAVMSRPSTFTVTVSPISSPMPAAISSANDTSGGPS
jgi:hypothetical protein